MRQDIDDSLGSDISLDVISGCGIIVDSNTLRHSSMYELETIVLFVNTIHDAHMSGSVYRRTCEEDQIARTQVLAVDRCTLLILSCSRTIEFITELSKDEPCEA